MYINSLNTKQSLIKDALTISFLSEGIETSKKVLKTSLSACPLFQTEAFRLLVSGADLPLNSYCLEQETLNSEDHL